VNFDATNGQLILTRQDMPPATVVSNTECQDVRMLDK
jgi:hypothetical protein